MHRAPLLSWVFVLGCGGGTATNPPAGDSPAEAPAVPAPGAVSDSPAAAEGAPAGEPTGAVTPDQQSNDPADLAITQQIRQDVMASGSLSAGAKNVQIITREGVVTLRGPVSAAEKAEIAGLAQRAPGVKRVDDQLEVKAP